jgi:hypothetical protein
VYITLYNNLLLLQYTAVRLDLAEKKGLKIPRSNQKQENEEGKTIQWPKEKGQKTIHKTFHGQLKIEHHEPH